MGNWGKIQMRKEEDDFIHLAHSPPAKIKPLKRIFCRFYQRQK